MLAMDTVPRYQSRPQFQPQNRPLFQTRRPLNRSQFQNKTQYQSNQNIGRFQNRPRSQSQSRIQNRNQNQIANRNQNKTQGRNRRRGPSQNRSGRGNNSSQPFNKGKGTSIPKYRVLSIFTDSCWYYSRLHPLKMLKLLSTEVKIFFNRLPLSDAVRKQKILLYRVFLVKYCHI